MRDKEERDLFAVTDLKISFYYILRKIRESWRTKSTWLIPPRVSSCLIGNHLLDAWIQGLFFSIPNVSKRVGTCHSHLLATRDLSHSHEFRQLDLRTINPRRSSEVKSEQMPIFRQELPFLPFFFSHPVCIRVHFEWHFLLLRLLNHN